MIIRTRCNRALVACSVAALTLGLAACGSSSKHKSTSTASASTPSSTAAKPTGAPLVVETMSPINTPVASLPQVFAGVEGAARAINAAGGIKGRPIKVITCNTNLNPDQELACARQAVSAGAIATVGTSLSTNGPGVFGAYQSAGMAAVASQGNVPQAFTSPVAFPVDVFAATTTPCVTKAVNQKNGIQAVLQIPSIENIADVTHSVADKLGFPLKPQIGFSPTTSDYQSLAQRISSAGTHYVIFNGSESEDLGFLTAASSLGANLTVCVNDNLTAGPLAKLGSAAANVYAGTSFPPLSSAGSYPMLQQFEQQMHAEQAAGDSAASLALSNYNTLMLRSWLGMQVFKQVAEAISGPITRQSFLAQIKKTTINLGGLVPNINFAKPSKVGVYTRVFNGRVNLEKWDASKKEWILVPGGTVDLVTDAIPFGSLAH